LIGWASQPASNDAALAPAINLRRVISLLTGAPGNHVKNLPRMQ
jgi:hypothetical protein